MTIDDDPTRGVWLNVAGVQSRIGRGRRRVLEALARGLEQRERGEKLRPGALRGYEAMRGGTWSVHVDDIDSWMRGEGGPAEGSVERTSSDPTPPFAPELVADRPPHESEPQR